MKPTALRKHRVVATWSILESDSIGSRALVADEAMIRFDAEGTGAFRVDGTLAKLSWKEDEETGTVKFSWKSVEDKRVIGDGNASIVTGGLLYFSIWRPAGTEFSFIARKVKKTASW